MNPEILNKDKFKTWLLPHLPGLYRFALKLSGNSFDADDLLSDTILKALEKNDQLNDKSRFKPWLFTVMNNRHIDLCRGRGIHREVDINQTDSTEEDYSLYNELSHSSLTAEGNPEVSFISKVLDEDIKSAIDQLPQEFQAALVLCDMEGFSYAEIADILQIPVGTVRSRIARARALLQKKLWKHAEELGIVKVQRLVNEPYVCTCGKE